MYSYEDPNSDYLKGIYQSNAVPNNDLIGNYSNQDGFVYDWLSASSPSASNTNYNAYTPDSEYIDRKNMYTVPAPFPQLNSKDGEMPLHYLNNQANKVAYIPPQPDNSNFVPFNEYMNHSGTSPRRMKYTNDATHVCSSSCNANIANVNESLNLSCQPSFTYSQTEAPNNNQHYNANTVEQNGTSNRRTLLPNMNYKLYNENCEVHPYQGCFSDENNGVTKMPCKQFLDDTTTKNSRKPHLHCYQENQNDANTDETLENNFCQQTNECSNPFKIKCFPKSHACTDDVPQNICRIECKAQISNLKSNENPICCHPNSEMDDPCANAMRNLKCIEDIVKSNPNYVQYSCCIPGDNLKNIPSPINKKDKLNTSSSNQEFNNGNKKGDNKYPDISYKPTKLDTGSEERIHILLDHFVKHYCCCQFILDMIQSEMKNCHLPNEMSEKINGRFECLKENLNNLKEQFQESSSCNIASDTLNDTFKPMCEYCENHENHPHNQVCMSCVLKNICPRHSPKTQENLLEDTLYNMPLLDSEEEIREEEKLDNPSDHQVVNSADFESYQNVRPSLKVRNPNYHTENGKTYKAPKDEGEFDDKENSCLKCIGNFASPDKMKCFPSIICIKQDPEVFPFSYGMFPEISAKKSQSDYFSNPPKSNINVKARHFDKSSENTNSELNRHLNRSGMNQSKNDGMPSISIEGTKAECNEYSKISKYFLKDSYDNFRLYENKRDAVENSSSNREHYKQNVQSEVVQKPLAKNSHLTPPHDRMKYSAEMLNKTPLQKSESFNPKSVSNNEPVYKNRVNSYITAQYSPIINCAPRLSVEGVTKNQKDLFQYCYEIFPIPSVKANDVE